MNVQKEPKILINQIERTNVIPLELLDPIAFTSVYTTFDWYSLTLAQRAVMENYLSQVIKQCPLISKDPMFTTENRKMIVRRFAHHFRRNSTYTDQFMQLIRSPMSKLGLIVGSPPGKWLDARPYGHFKSQSDLINYLLTGGIVFKRDDDTEVEVEFDFLGKTWDTYQPFVRFQSYKWSLGFPNVHTKKAWKTALGWLDSLATNLDATRRNISMVLLSKEENIIEWEFKMTVESNTQIRLTRLVTLRITPNLIPWCARHTMISISSDGVQVGHLLKRLDPEKWMTYTFTLSAICEMLGSGRMTIFPTDRIILQPKEQVFSTHPAVTSSIDARNRAIADRKVWTTAVIAGKGEGKSSFIKLIEATHGNEIYCEDSDDYGCYLSFLVEKGFERERLFTLNEHQMLDYVKEWLSLPRSEMDQYRSYFNVVAEELVHAVWVAEDHVLKKMKNVREQVAFFLKHEPLFESMEAVITAVFKNEIINQRLYDLGIKEYLRSKDIYWHLAFLHYPADLAHRPPPDEQVGFQSLADPDVSLLTRDISKGQSRIQVIADHVLQVIYRQANRKMSHFLSGSGLLSMFPKTVEKSSTLLDRFGINPLLDGADFVRVE